jgi:hypothetical protein
MNIRDNHPNGCFQQQILTLGHFRNVEKKMIASFFSKFGLIERTALENQQTCNSFKAPIVHIPHLCIDIDIVLTDNDCAIKMFIKSGRQLYVCPNYLKITVCEVLEVKQFCIIISPHLYSSKNF